MTFGEIFSEAVSCLFFVGGVLAKLRLGVKHLAW